MPAGYVAARPHGYALAGLWPRLIARFLDIVVVALLNVLVNGWFAYQWLRDFIPLLRQAFRDPLAPQPHPPDRLSQLTWTMLIIATALWLAYEVPAIGNSGQTLGKRIMGIRVVRLDSMEQVGLGRAFQRWARLGLWTPLWGCWGFGLVLQFIDSLSPVFDVKLHQALHDRTARTVVVQAPPALPRTAPEHTDDPAPEHTDDTTGGTR